MSVHFTRAARLLKLGNVLIEVYDDKLFDLPTELFLRIIYYLTPIELLILRVTSKKYRYFISRYAYKSTLFKYIKQFKKILTQIDTKVLFLFESSRVTLKRETKHFTKLIEFTIFKQITYHEYKITLPKSKTSLASSYDVIKFVPRQLLQSYRMWTGHKLFFSDVKLIQKFLCFLLDLHQLSFYEFIDLFEV